MTPKRERALQALLTQPTKAEAAAAAGIGVSTLRSYLHEPEFKAAYKEAVRSMIEDATRQAQQTLNPALTTLLEIVQDREAGHMARVSASRSLLEYGLRMTEINDIIAELNEGEE